MHNYPKPAAMALHSHAFCINPGHTIAAESSLMAIAVEQGAMSALKAAVKNFPANKEIGQFAKMVLDRRTSAHL